MPLYNHAKYLPQAIESILEQSYTNFELIICDDGSTDSSLEVAKRYKDSRIQIISKPNGGVASALNCCLLLSRGNFITWLSSDDYYINDNLYEHLKVHSKGAQISITNPGMILEDGMLTVYPSNRSINQELRLAHFFAGNNYINGLTVSFSRRLLAITGLFSTKYKYAQDEDYWIRLFKHEPLVFSKSESFHTVTRMYSSNFASERIGRILDTHYVVYEYLVEHGPIGMIPKEYTQQGLSEIVVEHLLSIILSPMFRPKGIFLLDQVLVGFINHLDSKLPTRSILKNKFIGILESEAAKIPYGRIRQRYNEVISMLENNGTEAKRAIGFSSHVRDLILDGFVKQDAEAISYLDFISRDRT